MTDVCMEGPFTTTTHEKRCCGFVHQPCDGLVRGATVVPHKSADKEGAPTVEDMGKYIERQFEPRPT